MSQEKDLHKITKFCSHKGFIYPGSEIYGGLANTWDYGPLGVELKNNIKREWWKYWVYNRDDIVGLDAAILMNPKTWVASGHVASFSDPLMDCKNCKARARADKLIEEFSDKRPDSWCGEKTPSEDVLAFVNEHKIPCPECGEVDWAEPKSFNLMFKTHQGVTEGSGTEVYLRPETAQGIFVNFKNVQRSTRRKLPFGIAQIGKAFRNEITPGNFTFRTREFEQMEIEYFFDPEDTPWEQLFADLKDVSKGFVEDVLELSKENLRFRDHDPDELSHYSKGTTDVEYKFPFGWGELCAAGAYRTDYDLKQHQEHSGENMEYRHEDGRTLIPHVIEPSFGADRLALAVIIDSYTEEELPQKDSLSSEGRAGEGSNETRIVMKLPYNIAPFKIAILPLMKKDGMAEKALEIQKALRQKDIMCDYDQAGSIGKRYRRQDENGTPWCATVDYQTMEDGTVTLRHRDTMEQVGEGGRVKIEELGEWLSAERF